VRASTTQQIVVDRMRLTTVLVLGWRITSGRRGTYGRIGRIILRQMTCTGGHSSPEQTCFGAIWKFNLVIGAVEYRGNVDLRVFPLKPRCLLMAHIGISSVSVNEKGHHVSVNIHPHHH